MKRARWCGIVAVAVLPALVGCGGEGSTVAESDSSVPGDTSATASATLTATPAPTASESASSASSGGPTPGSSFSLPYGVGSVMSVIGVAHDDVLNLRTGPGTGFAVRRTLDPLATGLVATGRGWQVPGGPLWAEVTASGTTGWVSLRYLAVRDGTEDLTARAIERLGRRPSAGSMEELGRVVARSLASTDPPSSVVMSKAPSLGDLGEVTYDVVGLGDDSVRALRLTVFGQPGGGFSLKSVEATSYCARGSSAGGELCP